MLKGKFLLDENLTPNEKGHLTMLMMSVGKSDLMGRILSGELGRNDVKELKVFLEKLIANCEADSEPNSASEQIASVSRSIVAKFEDFLR